MAGMIAEAMKKQCISGERAVTIAGWGAGD
jgi:hypothetical protein